MASLRQSIELSEELTIEPSFFVSIARAAFGGKVEIRATLQGLANDLTRTHYDVILGGSDLHEAAENVTWSPWSAELALPGQLSARLRNLGSDCLALSAIPNARLRVERQFAIACAATPGGEAFAASLVDSGLGEIDPEELSRVVRAAGLIPRILWAGPSCLFAFDLLAFRPGCEELARAVIARRMLELERLQTPRARCANEPTLAGKPQVAFPYVTELYLFERV